MKNKYIYLLCISLGSVVSAQMINYHTTGTAIKPTPMQDTTLYSSTAVIALMTSIMGGTDQTMPGAGHWYIGNKNAQPKNWAQTTSRKTKKGSWGRVPVKVR